LGLGPVWALWRVGAIGRLPVLRVGYLTVLDETGEPSMRCRLVAHGAGDPRGRRVRVLMPDPDLYQTSMAS
jgi:hypothetical protein